MAETCKHCGRCRGSVYLSSCPDKDWHLNSTGPRPKTTVSAYVTNELHDQVEAAARRMNIKMSQFMELALRAFLEDDDDIELTNGAI